MVGIETYENVVVKKLNEHKQTGNPILTLYGELRWINLKVGDRVVIGKKDGALVIRPLREVEVHISDKSSDKDDITDSTD